MDKALCYAQMDASFHLCSRNCLQAARSQLDGFVARSFLLDTARERIPYAIWNCRKNFFPNTTRHTKFEFQARLGELDLVRDNHGILAILLRPKGELPALDLLEAPRGQEVKNHVLSAFQLCIG